MLANAIFTPFPDPKTVRQRAKNTTFSIDNLLIQLAVDSYKCIDKEAIIWGSL